MKDFELKLGQTTYKCTSNHASATAQNWIISAEYHDLKINMTIPESSNVPMDKVLVFISSFDEALKIVQSQKSKDLTFINQLT